jgi:hypothetical protein
MLLLDKESKRNRGLVNNDNYFTQVMLILQSNLPENKSIAFALANL